MRAADLRDPGRLVTGLISRELLREQLPADTFGRPDPADVSLAKTADRSVLGCMNDMAFMRETVTTRSGGLATTDIAGLNQPLRRNINSARGLPAAGRTDRPASACDALSTLPCCPPQMTRLPRRGLPYGRQVEENGFRYGRAHFDLDSLDSGAVTPDDPDRTTPDQAKKTAAAVVRTARKALADAGA